VTTSGGGIVLRPAKHFSTALDVDFETFRNHGDILTLAELAASDPLIPPPIDAANAARAIDFVPETNRLSASLRTTGRVRAAKLHGEAFFTRLEQTGNEAPLQSLLGLDQPDVTTWSVSGGFDVPLTHDFALNGSVRAFFRDNDVDEDAIVETSLDDVQLAPYIRRRREVRPRLELTSRPQAGTLLGLGYRSRLVHRDLRYGDQPGGTITKPVSLIEEDTQQHTVYARGSTRLLRSLQLSGELGYEWAPKVGLPRELEESVYLETRGSYTLFRPLPVTLSVFGKVRDGENDDVDLEASNTTKHKKFEQTLWSWGLTISAVPWERTSMFASFVQNGDDQEFDYLRSNVPRSSLAPYELFLDSRPDYESDVRSLIVGGRAPLTDRLEANLSTTWTWNRVRFPDGGQTAQVLEDVNEIKSRILSVEARLGYQVLSRLRVEVGYRFDDFRDRADQELLGLDTDKQTYTLAFKFDL
jgi:hypothetical protein